MKAGHLFEKALQEADIELKPGTEIKVKVKTKGGHLRLVIDKSNITDFEATVLQRSHDSLQTARPYSPKLPVGQKIRSLRMGRGLTLQKLASKAGMSRGSLGSIEKGERSVGLEVLKRISNALDLPVACLLD